MKSYLGYIPSGNITYALQYQDAFEFLFNNRKKARKETKLFDLPLLYLLRHYVELSLKYNIEYFKNYSDISDMSMQLETSHDLNKLYDAFKNHIIKSFIKLNISEELKSDLRKKIKSLEFLVKQLKKIDDNMGQSLKYYKNKKAEINIDENIQIDLIEEIGKPYKKCKDLLDYSIDEHNRLLKLSAKE